MTKIINKKKFEKKCKKSTKKKDFHWQNKDKKNKGKIKRVRFQVSHDFCELTG